MSPTEWALVITALGGFGGIGTMLASVSKKASRLDEATKPNHGSSMTDSLARIEKALSVLSADTAHATELSRSVAHQVGEIRRDLSGLREHVDDITEVNMRIH